MIIDTHTHIFCWGENPEQGYLSPTTRRSWLTRLIVRLTGLNQIPGATISEKIRNRLVNHLDASQLDFAVVLAQDAVYRENGSRDDMATHFYVSNDYVLQLAQQSSKVIPACSINPIRRDALQELERCRRLGCRIVKVHTAIQGVDPSRADFEPFYRLAADLGVVLMFHTGYEHSCTVVSQKYTDPRKLQRVLDFGRPVIAAHCGTCAFFDREDYYPHFVDMMHRHDNLYGDTAVMASLIRWNALNRLSRESESVRSRILHGSDYPLPPSRIPYLRRVGLWPQERKNPLDLDLRIKQSFLFGDNYAGHIHDLLGLTAPNTAQISGDTHERANSSRETDQRRHGLRHTDSTHDQSVDR